MFDFSEMDPFFDDEAANQNAKNCIELLICLIYVNMCVYVYTYIYIYIHICIPKPMHNIYIYIYICIPRPMHRAKMIEHWGQRINANICVELFNLSHMCIYTNIYINIHIHIHTYIYIYIDSPQENAREAKMIEGWGQRFIARRFALRWKHKCDK